MEAILAERDKRRKPSTRDTFEKRAIDHELIRAKTEKRGVKICLPFETSYVDANCECEAKVVFVDKDSIKFEIRGREIWILRAFIVSAEIVK